jgi:serine/threonine protein kinase/Tol biopolymer transport system component
MPSHAQCTSPMIGQVLGHYRILEKIGEGGMGEVFRARDDRLSRDVALKIIRPAAYGDPDRLRRFEQEAQAAAALNHPNIVAIYDVGFHEGHPYIVSELLEGKTLRERLFEGAIPIKQASDFALQVAQGLLAAHDKHIIHRDLKPENLFITKDQRIKILDFGIAKLTLHDSQSTTLQSMTTQTKSGVVLGTAAYMSPEQLRAKPVDYRTDIFTFGSILYEMLAGRRAFRGETDADTITAVLREDPPDLSEVRPAVPAAFEPVVAHCLEKNPDDRFQSARDLVFALKTLSDPGIAKSTQQFKVIPRRIPTWAGWVVALFILASVAWLLTSNRISFRSATPSFSRLTFQRGTIYSARFGPEGRSIVYDASWNGRPHSLFYTFSDAPLERPSDLKDAYLLSISRSNELALILHGNHGSRLDFINGTLARAPLVGGAPRELQTNVRWADWDPKGELAVVQYQSGRSKIVYPPGHTLYETADWISDIRVSPTGDRIAFMDHPGIWDDRGSVSVIDLNGAKTTLSAGWESETGLAWNPKGDEVWFTGARGGYNRVLWAVTLSGKERQILAIPGGMTLQDIAPDGRVLITSLTERLAMETADEKRGTAVDLSLYDWTIAKDISRDGKKVLFEEASEPTGANYWVCIRDSAGSPPVRLGDGSVGGLSPDGNWALAVFTGTPQHISILPTGAGEPRTIVPAGIEELQNGSAHFLPDGQHIIFTGHEPHHLMRSFVIDISGDNLHPVTAEGVPFADYSVSPDGKLVASLDANDKAELYALDGSSPKPIPGLEVEEIPFQWSDDSSSVFVFQKGEVPLKVFRVNVNTGKRERLPDLSPADATGVVTVGPVVSTRDGSRFVYSYYQVISVLYVVSGLK